MAVNVGSAQVVKLVDNVLSEREETVKNDGPNSVVISKDPQMTAAGADTFIVASGAEQDVTLADGEALYAICAGGQTASVELI
jgi:hypothetical protein